jgi:hypothetical protein
MASRALAPGVPGQPPRHPRGGLRAHQGGARGDGGESEGLTTATTQKKTDYSGTPLHKKLGIKEESLVLLVSAPTGFHNLLGPLPEGAEIVQGPGDPLDVVLLFVTQQEGLQGRFDELAEMLTSAGGLWVAWPKKSSKIGTDLGFEAVQGIGLASGMVDNKSCAIDADWQGLRFVYRKKDRGARD